MPQLSYPLSRPRRPWSAPLLSAVATGGLVLSSVVVASPATADTADVIDAAAYLGADDVADTSLPESLPVGDDEHDVTWEIDSDTFSTPYSSVTVAGTANDEAVTAVVEVLPPAEHSLTYFVDAGRHGDAQDAWYSDLETDSQAFTAASTLAADSLHNTAPDQPYDPEANDWGYVAEDSEDYKLSIPGGDPGESTNLESFDKYELGVRTTSEELSFALALDPGTYTLSSGFYEFYAADQDRHREIEPVISYDRDGESATVDLGATDLSTPADDAAGVLANNSFTVPEDAENVRLSYTQAGGEAPLVSWFAVAEGDAQEVLDEAWEQRPEPEQDDVEVTIDADDIDADNRNGLTFKGFGTLSANSTSAVLMDYKSENPEAYAQLLRVLFGGDHPIMNQVKIEMGNDRNNSTGPDVATMRTADEPANVTRNPGFQLAADAKRVNPDLKVSILRWNAPDWVDDNDDVYTWYTNTILAAYREYGYMVDYVNPGVNEQEADLDWTKEYADRIQADETGYVSEDSDLAGFRDGEADLFHDIEVVISDELSVGSFGDAMIDDEDLRDAVDVAGYHYSPYDDADGNFTRLAEEFDTEIWNSEAQATFSNSAFRPHNNMADPSVEGTGLGGTGSALEMANTVVKGFTESRRTHFIYQPAIGSFYEGGQYSFKELVSARDPWSGWMHYDGGLAVLQHFANFAVTGWEDDENTAGIWRTVPQASSSGADGENPVVGRNGKPNYMTMAAPDGSDFSTVIVNDSEEALTYELSPEGFDEDQLSIWETRAADEGEAFDSNYKRHQGDVTATDGSYTIEVEPFSIVTVTTLDQSDDTNWNDPLPTEGERSVLDTDPEHGVLWRDDFDYSDRSVPVITGDGEVGSDTESFVDSRGGHTGAIPLFSWDRNGAFEAHEGDDGWALRQQVDEQATGVGGAWNGGDPITAIGDRRWANYDASVDVNFERDTTDGNYAAIGARSSGGDNSQSLNSSGYVLKLDREGAWELMRRGEVIDSGQLPDMDGDWHELSIEVAGERITGAVDGEEVASWTDPEPIRSGWVDLASGFHHTQFADLQVDRVDGYVPYYGDYLDDQEMTDLSDPPATQLRYTGGWDHANGGDMYEYQRSTSTNTASDAAVSYSFTGSGLDVIGSGEESTRLNVYVDDELVDVNARTTPTGQFQQAYTLRGLPFGDHDVRIEVASGDLMLDAVGVVSVSADDPAATEDLAAELESAEQIERTDDFTDETWQALQHAISDAGAAVDDPAAYRLDGEGAEHLIARLQAGSAPLWSQIESVETIHTATEVGDEPDLPDSITATLQDESTREITVDWDMSELDLEDAWSTQAVSAVYGYASITGTVEVVPANTVAFADIGATEDGELEQDSPAYDAIADLEPELLNDRPDQVLDGTWGHWAENGAGDEDIQYKGPEDGDYDKLTTTGMYTDNASGSEITYTVTAPAGQYTFTAGSHSWWADNARTAEVILTYDDTEHPVDSITLDGDSPSQTLRHDVTLDDEGLITLTLRNTSDQSPMLSWVGLNEDADDDDGGNDSDGDDDNSSGADDSGGADSGSNGADDAADSEGSDDADSGREAGDADDSGDVGGSDSPDDLDDLPSTGSDIVGLLLVTALFAAAGAVFLAHRRRFS